MLNILRNQPAVASSGGVGYARSSMWLFRIGFSSTEIDFRNVAEGYVLCGYLSYEEPCVTPFGDCVRLRCPLFFDVVLGSCAPGSVLGYALQCNTRPIHTLPWHGPRTSLLTTYAYVAFIYLSSVERWPCVTRAPKHTHCGIEYTDTHRNFC